MQTDLLVDIDVDDSHYLKRVTELGDNVDLVTNEDLYSSTGIKLVNKGSKINHEFYDKLIQHKLLKPIDESVEIKGGSIINSATLMGKAQHLINNDPHISLLFRSMPYTDVPVRLFQELVINSILSFKLTLARETIDGIYDHSLKVALVAIYLGIRLGLDRSDLLTLTTAGLFHDIGQLHLDPACLKDESEASGDELKQIHAHPVLGFLIFNNFKKEYPNVARTILDHHEYLDGSGYPRALLEEKISPLAKILTLAELAVTSYGDISHKHAIARLKTRLLINERRYDKQLVKFLMHAYGQETIPAPELDIENMSNFMKQMEVVCQVLNNWDKLLPALNEIESQPAADSPFGFIKYRIEGMNHALQDSGFNVQDFKQVVRELEDDKSGVYEGLLVSYECLYQLEALLLLFSHKWPDYHQNKSGKLSQLISDWVTKSEDMLLKLNIPKIDTVLG